MKTKIIEVTNRAGNAEHEFNHGKFLIGRFDHEWERPAFAAPQAFTLLSTICGWTRSHVLVLDLQTGEGAIFKHGGLASADLNKHKIWVCPMFEPFLAWLYMQDVTQLSTLQDTIDLDVPGELSGYRRPGTSRR